MFEWNKNVQGMIEYVEENLTKSITLEMIAAALNYSPFYCTRQFHKYANISLRNYIRLRKVSAAVLDLRDTKERVTDIAIKYGFSSLEAFTHAFVKAFGLTPSMYRKMPKPLPLLIKRNIYNPYYLGLGEFKDNKQELQEVQVSIQVLPEHRFIGIRHIDVDNYFNFWALQENVSEYDCNAVCGLLESIKSFNGQIGGWFNTNGKKGYLYGIEVPVDYNGDVPQGMESTLIPESLYVVFHYQPYAYDKIDTSVHEKLRQKMISWSPVEHGYEYNDAVNPTYHRHAPENYGQAICRPIKMKN
ncbi:MAG: AraC family transcriptional regulator [Clostridia bacterium]|nr:AraC family transcriptional regulator [Clostridia bacterium]